MSSSTWRPRRHRQPPRTEGAPTSSAVSEQVASIETQLRDMKHTKLQARVADLEEKVFGTARI